MTRLVLESFYYARDGRNAKLLRAGKTVRVPEDILPEHVARFAFEGKIEMVVETLAESDVFDVSTEDGHRWGSVKHLNKPKARKK
jgi:hypothetical protein